MVSLPGLDLSDIESLLTRLRLDRSVQPVTGFRGGYNEALRRLHSFLQDGIASYPQKHGNPASNCASSLSPFLHFGQISPLQVALEAKKSPHRAGREAFLEQLIVRRELSANFTHFHPAYDSFDCLPDWARKTLHDHEGDERPQLYSLEQLEQAETGDPYWNAAQREMLKTGMMHNYMRMYWGKKILEWSPNPAEAFRRALYLNNRYELDGRDANGFAGVAWCFGKHDRPWGERPVFGKVRYMNEAGLRRKFDMASYLERVPGRNLQ
jgi:deoxyribodipyrimidine photo-lyase